MNQIQNASFLDGTQGFEGGGLVVDEANLGGPGRAVLTGTGLSINSAYANGPTVAVDDLLEVSVLAEVGSVVKLQIQAGDEVAIPLKQQGEGPTSRGLPHTMSQYRARVKAPSAGKARIHVSQAVAGLHISRPYLEPVGKNARERMWTPGLHMSDDLNIPIWPSNFPQFKPDTVQINPTAVRKAFSGDIPVPATTRLSMTPAYNFRGDMELSSAEYDQLERLCYEESEPFWFVRPDTRQLCHAFWSEDGQPTANGSHNIIRRVTVGLLLQVV